MGSVGEGGDTRGKVACIIICMINFYHSTKITFSSGKMEIKYFERNLGKYSEIDQS